MYQTDFESRDDETTICISYIFVKIMSQNAKNKFEHCAIHMNSYPKPEEAVFVGVRNSKGDGYVGRSLQERGVTLICFIYADNPLL